MFFWTKKKTNNSQYKNTCVNTRWNVTYAVHHNMIEYVSDVVPVEWKGHDDDDECWVCDIKSAPKPETVFPGSSKQSSKRRKADSRQGSVKKEVSSLCFKMQTDTYT